MRTSRVSKDAAKLFDRGSSPAPLPRRSTRSAIARFNHATTSPHRESNGTTPDIEDGIGPPAKRHKRAVASSPANGVKSELEDDALPAIPPSTKSPRRVRKPARKTTDASTGETTVAAPSDWEEMYNTVKKMRSPGGSAYGAAVDTMGCERLADNQASAKDQRFHTLVALMLSSQTKDTVNAVAMKRLKAELPAHNPGAATGLNVDNMLAVDPKLLNELIWAVGFHNNKTKYLKQTAEILRDKWNGDIPDTIQGLTSLPGVGPKMGYLCLSAAWGRTEGIGVDVHVHRITNLWGWHSTTTPEGTRAALQAWLPRDRWREINIMLVGLGQTVCLPVGRRCGDCELGLGGLCKAADKKKVGEGRRARAAAAAADVEEDREEEVKLEVDGVKREVVKREGIREVIHNQIIPGIVEEELIRQI